MMSMHWPYSIQRNQILPWLQLEGQVSLLLLMIFLSKINYIPTTSTHSWIITWAKNGQTCLVIKIQLQRVTWSFWRLALSTFHLNWLMRTIEISTFGLLTVVPLLQLKRRIYSGTWHIVSSYFYISSFQFSSSLFKILSLKSLWRKKTLIRLFL